MTTGYGHDQGPSSGSLLCNGLPSSSRMGAPSPSQAGSLASNSQNRLAEACSAARMLDTVSAARLRRRCRHYPKH